MKLLHLPNDPNESDPQVRQVGSRTAFERLHRIGKLKEYEVIPFLSELAKSGDYKSVQALIRSAVARMRPDILFWHHISAFPVSPGFITELRSLSPGMLIVYHEGDAYGSIIKPISSSMRILAANADLVFLVALGNMATLMRAAGATDIRYLPHSYDDIRFGQPWALTSARTHDVIMIANHVRKRIPGTYLAGGRNRYRLAHRLKKTYRDRFALFGSGWSPSISNLGRLPFTDQESAIRSAWISVGWDHFDSYNYYFSDRLPISLAAGVPHVTNAQRGLRSMFAGCDGVYFCDTIHDCISTVDWLLSQSKEFLIEQGSAAQRWAKENMTADIIYTRALNICVGKRLREHGTS